MGGQLDGNFLPSSLPHKFTLIVTSIVCFVVNNFFSLSPGPRRHSSKPATTACGGRVGQTDIEADVRPIVA